MTACLSIDRETYLSPNYSERRGNVSPTILVLHYTACPMDEALKRLTSKAQAVSAHYLLPTDGNKIYNLVDETHRAWHAGVSQWRGVNDVNSFSIGIENVNWGYTYGWLPAEPTNPIVRYFWSSMIHLERRLGEFLEARQLFCFQKQWHYFPKKQVDTLTILAKDILSRWQIDAENVVGHSDISPQRKVDPGPLFPWEALAEKGVGVWYDPFVDRVHSNKPKGISVSWMQAGLQKWGYSVPQNGKLDPETEKVMQAFQMHFRPENYGGAIDEECANILDRLLCQRDNKKDQ
ncbi:N-acetylmuramoyl-L-alanine amidase [Parachlamydia sp. AcF125]|uniref:N-acetylmuramoyl-L-alanine amidase n=1 Tax=Parachlamydia sp. AcF125 TaxID=2795736 RepID=UPI001BC9EB4B|nr:N-acetylmuramoyl-L-alanine amidase [Parachlamydia sp. AcF125]MBS4168210.1 N-acetylmuramoyl-L-alanine amidase AmiD [Parachlamydia sp. AcF125]